MHRRVGRHPSEGRVEPVLVDEVQPLLQLGVAPLDIVGSLVELVGAPLEAIGVTLQCVDVSV